MLLGAVFKITGTQPLTFVPLKGDYTRRPAAHCALSRHRVPDAVEVSIPTQAAARWSSGSAASMRALRAVVKALYRAYCVDDRDISDPDVAASVAAEAGSDRSAARAAIDDTAVKDALKRDVDAAIAAGVFGSPFVIVDGEPFWGLDRFDQIERWLKSGGF
jgi:2-hydroxychromene-2-carboxylate isomerase